MKITEPIIEITSILTTWCFKITHQMSLNWIVTILYTNLDWNMFRFNTILFTFLTALLNSTESKLVLEEVKQCPGKFPIQLNTERAEIVDGKLKIKANITVNSPMATIPITMQYKYCSNKRSCSSLNSLQIKNICPFFSQKSFLGPKLSQFFKPSFLCPVKTDFYQADVTVPMRLLNKLAVLNGNGFFFKYLVTKTPNPNSGTIFCLNIKVKSVV